MTFIVSTNLGPHIVSSIRHYINIHVSISLRKRDLLSDITGKTEVNHFE